DSPVAGKVLLEKGFELEAIHFSQEPFTDDTPEKKSLLLARALGLKEVLVVNAGECFKEIADNSYREYYFILIKRFMMRVAEKIASEKHIRFLATGESLGQVSSQTLSNLNTIHQSTKIEILRPLIFMNKQEIIDKSVKEKYFDISKGPEMCDALASGSPKTRSEALDVEKQEIHCKMDELIKKAVKNTRIESTAKEIELPKQIEKTCN
ncbi:MAG: hypothetical protein NTY48_00465, partial [Candidatus Diapherotrites archaeon]|nr:hypothetical protein [Candidatus Diapherotrites archaeon]